ncbi:MAG: single-stranded-DNA-specific exonuclease RecJ [Ruminococcaceae bacterium]|nr:single-stranded-DNA-specific exonuclease RecJ [Oscillospiraceae bacterium]
MLEKEWVFLDENVNEAQAEAYAELFNIPVIVAKVLLNRGFTDAAEAKKFLDKNSDSFYSPSLLCDMEKAVARINEAIEKKEHVVVYGDYDVDGITSTALLVSFLREKGIDAQAYIPDRQNEGYGINKGAIKSISESGATLIISVDTGITAFEETEYAKELGCDVIITDHHECKQELPNAIAVINPKRIDCNYPFKDLAGVGVAFKLVCAASEKSERELLDEYADIVALGTIADVVSLKDENRIIAARGIEKLSKNPNTGLAAVISTLGLRQKWNNCAVVSYSIAPRLNAAGRMSNAMIAVNLLLTKDPLEAQELAIKLDTDNKNRQNEEKIIFDQAVEMINGTDIADKKVLVLAKRNWHHGIIGVVASRICERYNKTCILISIEDEWCKSSGRSVEGLNLFDALGHCSDILEKFGGHAYAAGFSIKEEYIPELDRRLNEFANQCQCEEKLPRILIDSKITVKDINAATIRKTEVLAPYGAGNKVPIFALMNAKIVDIKTLSEGKHCRLLVESENRLVEAIAFGSGSMASEFCIGDLVDIAGELNINLYNGQVRLQIIVSGIRIVHKEIGEILPDRNDFVEIYRYLRQNGNMSDELANLSGQLTDKLGRRIMREKLINVLRVFKDLEILNFNKLGDVVQITLNETEKGKKVSIDKSKEYQLIKKEAEELYK